MGGERPDAAATLWAAAANARAWAGSMHTHAAHKRFQKAWAAYAKAASAMKRSTEERGRIIRDPDRMDTDSMARAADGMKQGMAAMGRAADAFRRSSRLARAAAAEMRRAALAYERAGDQKNAGVMRTWAAKSREHALLADEWVERASDEAKMMKRGHDTLAASAAKWSAIGCKWDGDRRSMDLAQADSWENVKEASAWSAEKARRSKDAVEVAARAVNLTAALAEKSAAAAAAAAREPAGPDVQEAADAWRRAMASANRVDAKGR